MVTLTRKYARCRYVFFPAQSRPYLEHGIFEGNQNDRNNSGESNLPDVGNFIDGGMNLHYDDYYNRNTVWNSNGDEEADEEVNHFPTYTMYGSNGDDEADEETHSEDMWYNQAPCGV